MCDDLLGPDGRLNDKYVGTHYFTHEEAMHMLIVGHLTDSMAPNLSHMSRLGYFRTWQ